MDSFCDNAEELRFFDALEQIAPASDFLEDCPGFKNWEYDVWIGTPQSVSERKRKFVRWMGLGSDGLGGDNSVERYDNNEDGSFRGDIDRIMQNSGTVLRTSSIEEGFSSSRSSVSRWSNDDLDLSRGEDLIGDRNANGNLDRGSECIIDGLVENERLGKLQVTNFDQLLTSGEFGKVSQSFPSVQQSVQTEIGANCNAPRTKNTFKERWLSKLRSMTCMMSRNEEDDNAESKNFSQIQETRARKVRVRHCQKRLKELSALFTGQDIQAHEGSILTMKFSADGQYLASAGEDKLVRVWQVVEDQRSDTIDIADADPSCVYFSMNHLSELGPLEVEKDNINKSKSLKKTTDSACVVVPPKVFRILEKPLHVFQGHSGEILDLSWSNNDCLLSSSVDKTVRLWRVGVDRCLKVFSHSDYVTCIQFNPVNDDYFISGSIDGKVRIWEINGCQVVDWTETKDIITAISYRPDGQGGIVGSITGTCRLFKISDNHLLLESQMCLASKKKSPSKRITSFQFLPQDPSKVLVTCADSLVRIIDGMEVITKYKGLRNAGNHISASFTSDGKRIVSASEDSNVYIWNYIAHGTSSFSQPKAIRSFERFSSDASVVIPWSGLKIGNSENELKSRKHESSLNLLPFTPSAYFSSGQEFFLDSNPKGSATWPEEKLPTSTPLAVTSTMCKSQYKLLKTSCQSSASSHAWGLVLVTAGWDGKIRSFHNYGLPIPSWNKVA